METRITIDQDKNWCQIDLKPNQPGDLTDLGVLAHSMKYNPRGFVGGLKIESWHTREARIITTDPVLVNGFAEGVNKVFDSYLNNKNRVTT